MLRAVENNGESLIAAEENCCPNLAGVSDPGTETTGQSAVATAAWHPDSPPIFIAKYVIKRGLRDGYCCNSLILKSCNLQRRHIIEVRPFFRTDQGICATVPEAGTESIAWI
jgi:hypothetical protein